jgi:hypothetical protein
MKQYRLPKQSYKCGNSPSGLPCPAGPRGSRCSQIPSELGGNTCRPLRTLVWWSRSIQMTATLVALLVVSLAWSNLVGKQSIAPGPLTLAHAQLLVSAQNSVSGPNSIDSENRCAACHPGNETATATASAKQSALCLKCHIQDMPDAVHGSPHDLQGSALTELVKNGDRPETKTLLTKLVSRSPIHWQGSQTECSQCHREHQGTKHELQNMTTARCQACHRDAFHSFSTDHPEFKDYPYRGETNIAFDHIKHRDLHFTKKGAGFDCKTCHVLEDQVGVVGQVFRSVSFERACSSCHLEPVKSALQDGLIVLQVPSISINAMTLAGTEIGPWPMQASQLTDGVIPTVMRLLIESEPGGLSLLNQLPASGRLADLDSTSKKDRDTLQKLSIVTKQIMQKMANEGQPGFRSAVEKLLETEGGISNTFESAEQNPGRKPWLDRFASGIPPDLFRAAYDEWFEAADSKTKTVQSFPRGVSAFREASSNRSQDDDRLLGGAKSLLNRADDDLLNNGTSDLLDATGKQNPKSNGFKDSRAWDQLAFGGWMIDRQRMSIVYVPTGHADPWLSKWIELEEMRRDSKALSGDLQAQQSIALAQQCRQCHSLHSFNTSHPSPSLNWSVSFRKANQGGQDMLKTDRIENECWKSNRRAANLRPITKFDHGPHLTLPKLNDCQSCHELGKKDFLSMQKNQCSSCHQSNAAGESCTQCHNYHVGSKSWTGQH